MLYQLNETNALQLLDLLRRFEEVGLGDIINVRFIHSDMEQMP